MKEYTIEGLTGFVEKHKDEIVTDRQVVDIEKANEKMLALSTLLERIEYLLYYRDKMGDGHTLDTLQIVYSQYKHLQE